MTDTSKMKGNLTADSTNGKICGCLAPNGVLGFKGIPFAESPIGELRFKPPIPKNDWKGTLDAKKFGPIAPQAATISNSSSNGSPEQSEADCLTLNIWTPALDRGQSKCL